jgi:5-methylcytosine-specific restriction endonuclease McrA
MSANGTFAAENNPNWQGGYEPYYGPDWHQQRRLARKRDNYTCQRCGITEEKLGRQLDVHHKIPFREFGIDNYLNANQLANLISLCFTCHTTTEHEYRRQG